MASAQQKRRAVVTGMGVISPIGTGSAAFAQSLKNGVSGIDTISRFDAHSFATTFAGEAGDFEPDRLLAGMDVLSKTRERRVLLACGAARLAAEDARLSSEQFGAADAAVILASGIHPVIPDMDMLMTSGIYGSLFADSDQRPDKYAAAIAREASGENPRYPVASRTNNGVHAVARQCGITGPCHCVISACAASTQAIGEAYRSIQRGDADIVVTGGYDSMIFDFGMYAFCLLSLMSTKNDQPRQAMKPFDKNRDGFALGEGAGVLILEEERHAQRRGAPVYARIAGYGSSVDAYKVTDPHPEGTGAILSMTRALDDAHCEPEKIDYINAHGTATVKNDKIETAAIKHVFGPRAYRIPVSSTKSMIGHLMAAGGAVELIATITGMSSGFIPPTINYADPDPDCDLDYVPNSARHAAVQTALSNSFGLGGQNASIVVTRP